MATPTHRHTELASVSRFSKRWIPGQALNDDSERQHQPVYQAELFCITPING